VLSAVALFSPDLLYLTNFLMSDGLFASLTLLWLAAGMYAAVKPRNPWYALTHVVLLAALYTVRYSALFYIPVTAFILLRGSWKHAVWKVGVCILVLMCTHVSMKNEYSRQYGVDELAPFGGWQWMCNVTPLLPGLRTLDLSEIHGAEEQQLHRLLLHFPDSLYTVDNAISTAQMWNSNLPLKQILFFRMQSTRKEWAFAFAELGVDYGRYARQIAARQPFAFTRNFLVPSFVRLFHYHGDLGAQPFDCKKQKNLDWYEHDTSYAEHSTKLFDTVNPLRRVWFHVWIWLTLVCVVIVLLFWRTKGERNPADRSRQEEYMHTSLRCLTLFIVLYEAGSVAASGVHEWRYNAPLLLPSLLLILAIACHGSIWRRRGGKETH